jgi:hypothetical protein
VIKGEFDEAEVERTKKDRECSYAIPAPVNRIVVTGLRVGIILLDSARSKLNA